MDLYCVDTQIMVWGVCQESREDQSEMIPKAKRFLEWLEKRGKIFIPSIVLAELLVPVPKEKHEIILRIINKSFIVHNFDALASSIFADIWHQKKSSGILEELKDTGYTRRELKADAMIIATAVAKKATCIYSNDSKSDMIKFAEGIIRVEPMPDLEYQQDLFTLT